MAPICGVCHENESKYRCTKCELRYCSVICYKPHKAAHEVEDDIPPAHTATPIVQEQIQQAGCGGNNQRTVPNNGGSSHDGFENHEDFKQLLARYPKLKFELQLIFGVTLEPGPDDVYSWNKQKWFIDARDASGGGHIQPRGSQRSRGRGRGRGGFQDINIVPPEDRIRGPWTQAKGDQQGLDMIKRLKQASDQKLSEGMVEFVKLCTLKFG